MINNSDSEEIEDIILSIKKHKQLKDISNEAIKYHEAHKDDPYEKEPLNYIQERNPRKLISLSGPLGFTFFKNINGRKILLLGESHKVDTLCQSSLAYSIHRWLIELAIEAPECLDIFCEQVTNKKIKKETNILGKLFGLNKRHKETDETKHIILTHIMDPISRRYLKNYDSPLDAVRDTFRVCNNLTQGNQGLCPLPSLRYHVVDSRTVGKMENPFIEMSPKVFELGTKRITFVAEYVNVNHMEIWGYFSGLDRSKTSKQKFEAYSLMLFEGILDDPIEYVNRYLDNYFKIIDRTLKKVRNLIDLEKFKDCLYNASIFTEPTFKDFSGDEYSDIYKSSYLFFSVLYCTQMDVYFLLRWFQEYDLKKPGPSGCKDYKVAKNTIFYGGAKHQITYAEFFKEYFNVTPDIDIIHRDMDQCMFLSEEFDFFA